MSGVFTGIAPTKRVECIMCSGRGKNRDGTLCTLCHGGCYQTIDLTTDERLERIEEHLGMGWAS